MFNAAGDGVLVLSEVASLLGKPLAPLLPPWGTGIVAAALRRAGVRIPPEMLQQLRYGRALDNRKLKAAGFAFRGTSRETVQAFAEHLRTRGLRADAGAGYRYEREVEEFLRWSPAVRVGKHRWLRPARAQAPRARSAGGAGARLGVAALRARSAWRRAGRRRTTARCAPARPPPRAGPRRRSLRPSRSA